MRSKKKILKERAKNKRVRKEKARLRKIQNLKKHKPRYILVKLEDISMETINKLKSLAKEKRTSVSKLVRKLLNKKLEEEEKCLNLKEEQ